MKRLVHVLRVLFLVSVILIVPASVEAGTKSAKNKKIESEILKTAKKEAKFWGYQNASYTFADVDGDGIRECFLLATDNSFGNDKNHLFVFRYENKKTHIIASGMNINISRITIYRKTRTIVICGIYEHIYDKYSEKIKDCSYYHFKDGEYQYVLGKNLKIDPGEKWDYVNDLCRISKSTFNKERKKYEKGKALLMNLKNWKKISLKK